jgi:hypothetical protein
MPTLGGADATATALNDAGEAAGWSLDATGRKRAVMWRSGQIEALDTDTSSATAIDNSGAVFGTFSTTMTCGVRWFGGVRTILTYSDGSCVSYVADASATGTALAGGTKGWVLLRTDGTRSPIAPPPYTSYSLRALNDQELIVGSQNSFEQRALGIGFTAAFPSPYPFPGFSPHYSGSVARINNLGQFVGSAAGGASGTIKWFFGQAGGDVKALAGAFSITRSPSLVGLNDAGVVAAFNYQMQHGYFWKAGRTTRLTLTSQDWMIDSISDLNNAGWMTAHATHKTSGEKRAVLLIPN